MSTTLPQEILETLAAEAEADELLEAKERTVWDTGNSIATTLPQAFTSHADVEKGATMRAFYHPSSRAFVFIPRDE